MTVPRRLQTLFIIMAVLFIIAGVTGLVWMYRNADRAPEGATLVRAGEVRVEWSTQSSTDETSSSAFAQRSVAPLAS
jgi:flagellar basal body-associated protein FliL